MELIDKLSFTSYSDNSFIKEKCENISQVKNETPAGVSILLVNAKNGNYKYNKNFRKDPEIE